MSDDYLKELLNDAAEAMNEWLEDFKDYPLRSEVGRFVSETAEDLTPDMRRELVDLLSSDYSLGTTPQNTDGPWTEVWPIIQANVYERVEARLWETYNDWTPPFNGQFEENQRVYHADSGRYGHIDAIDERDQSLPYHIHFSDGSHGWAGEDDLIDADEADKLDLKYIKDQRVFCICLGQWGTIEQIDIKDPDCRYMLKLDDGNFVWTDTEDLAEYDTTIDTIDEEDLNEERGA